MLVQGYFVDHRIDTETDTQLKKFFTCILAIVLKSIDDLLKVLLETEKFPKDSSASQAILPSLSLGLNLRTVYEQTEIILLFLMPDVFYDLLSSILLEFLEISCFQIVPVSYLATYFGSRRLASAGLTRQFNVSLQL